MENETLPTVLRTLLPDPRPRTALTCIGRSTGTVCVGTLVTWGVHSVWRDDDTLYLGLLVQNRTPALRQAASRGLTLLDVHGVQYDASGSCASGVAPPQWALTAEIYPGAIARVWGVIPAAAEVVPSRLVWNVGQTLRPLPETTLPWVVSRGGEPLAVAWAELVHPV